MKNPVLNFDLSLIFVAEGIPAGFASPAEDYIESIIDLNKELIPNPTATFLARVKGHSMIDAGLSNGDVIVIDKSRTAKNNDIAVCFINGGFTIKRVKIENKTVMLLPANSDFKPIMVTPEDDFIIWGIVTYTIKKS